jgi:2-dehydropantoate 2-reductase
MKILVLGAGGIGGYFGGRLAQAGADVTFLVRPKRRDQIARDGLVVKSPLGDFTVKPQTVLAEAVRPDYDVVLFTCKAYDLDSAMDAVAPAMQGGRAALVPMLNGMAHFERLDSRFGAAQVMGGTCHINAMLKPDGTVFHADALQRLLFGERGSVSPTATAPQGGGSPRAEAFAAELARSKIDWKLSDDIEQDLWEKVVFLSALAANTCLHRGNVKEIMSAPGGRESMERTLAANVALATAEGHAPRAQQLEAARKRLTDPEGLWSASMLRDLEGGGPVEADHVVGWMLERLRRHGLDDTVMSLAYTHLKTYEARRRAGRL